jgi:hypothetical protein
MLCEEMGLGKTVEVLGLVCADAPAAKAAAAKAAGAKAAGAKAAVERRSTAASRRKSRRLDSRYVNNNSPRVVQHPVRLSVRRDVL